MTDVEIPRNTKRILDLTITKDGDTAYDLDDASIDSKTFKMKKYTQSETAVVDKTVTGGNSSGEIEVELTKSETDIRAGTYEIQFVIDHDDDRLFRTKDLPNITITPKL